MSESQAQLPRVTFRFPEALRSRLELAAKEANRSVNAEVIARLEKSFEDEASMNEMFDKVDYHEDAIKEIREAIEDINRSINALYRAR